MCVGDSLASYVFCLALSLALLLLIWFLWKESSAAPSIEMVPWTAIWVLIHALMKIEYSCPDMPWFRSICSAISWPDQSTASTWSRVQGLHAPSCHWRPSAAPLCLLDKDSQSLGTKPWCWWQCKKLLTSDPSDQNNCCLQEHVCWFILGPRWMHSPWVWRTVWSTVPKWSRKHSPWPLSSSKFS